jgi:hypothetical protein
LLLSLLLHWASKRRFGISVADNLTGFNLSSMAKFESQPNVCTRFFFCLLLLFGIPNVYAQHNSSDHTITRRLLSIEAGLASHEVFCGIQDEQGFLWFGTRNGLNRFDGKSSLLFSRQRNKLQDNKVVQLATDDAHQLFIVYGSAGFQLATNGKVDVMDLRTHSVSTLAQAFPNLPFKEKEVYWIAGDGSGELSFLTRAPFRLWKYSSKNGFRLRYEMKSWNNSSFDQRSSGPVCSFMNGNALLKLSNRDEQFYVTRDTVIVFRQQNALRSLPIGLSNKGELLLTYNTSQDTDAFKVDQLNPTGNLVPFKDLESSGLKKVKGSYWFQICTSVTGKAALFYIPSDAIYLWDGSAFFKVIEKPEKEPLPTLLFWPSAIGSA